MRAESVSAESVLCLALWPCDERIAAWSIWTALENGCRVGRSNAYVLRFVIVHVDLQAAFLFPALPLVSSKEQCVPVGRPRRNRKRVLGRRECRLARGGRRWSPRSRV